MNIMKSIATIKAYRKDPMNFIRHLHLENGHRSSLKIFNRELLVLSHPNDILHVLKGNHSNYTKGRSTKALKSIIGNGLITSEGDFWKHQHKLIRPVMNLKSVQAFCPKIFSTTETFFSELSEGNHNSLELMNKLTWRIILKTLFSEDSSPKMDLWLNDILFLLEEITRRTRAIIPIPQWMPTKGNKRFKKIITNFDSYIYQLIDKRRTEEPQNDLLQLLIDARDENGDGVMGNTQIRDEILTFLFAGHETITNTMTWSLIALAKNPQYLETLKSESAKFFVTRNYEDLNSSPWFNAVIDEVMRMYPPVWVFMRQAEGQDQIGDLVIKKGTNVVLAPFLAQMSKDFWKTPEIFCPERFLPENKSSIIQGSFFPFGLGPRACIGSYFASFESKIILASLIHHFDWSLSKIEEQTSIAGITLRPSNNIMMNFHRKKDV